MRLSCGPRSLLNATSYVVLTHGGKDFVTYVSTSSSQIASKSIPNYNYEAGFCPFFHALPLLIAFRGHRSKNWQIFHPHLSPLRLIVPTLLTCIRTSLILTLT